LWSERYDRPLKDIFALQDEIVQKIVTTLKLQLTLQEQGYLARKRTDNVEAYNCFLRGMASFLRTTREDNVQARQMFEKAVVLDSQYAEAYAGLGWTYREEWIFHWSADTHGLDRALELARRALTLDDSLPFAHALLSYVYMGKLQYDQAISEGERAIALDPNDADGYAHQADVFNFAGRPTEAVPAVKQAMQLNPHYPFWYIFDLGWAYYQTGRYIEAIAALKEASSRGPNFEGTHNILALSYLDQWIAQLSPADQTLEPAVTAIQRALTLNDSYHWSHIVSGFIELYDKQYDKALAEMERAVVLMPAEATSYGALAEVLSRVGRPTDAMTAVAKALQLKGEFPDNQFSSIGAAYAIAGHYEEARAPLQRYLSRYPNILPAHLMLAAVYSELGQTAEAQKEAAEVLRLNPNFSLAVHKQRMPIKDPAVLERHIAALRKAGLK
jgi:tetratricopeptide (TPR) repeat protein